MSEFLRAMRVVASNTIRELVRNKLLYNLLFFAVLLIASSMFVAQLTIGQWDRIILDQGLAHKEFLKQWVNGLEEYRKSLEPFTLEFAAETCGIPVDTLKQVAGMIAEAKRVCILWAMGVTQHTMGSDTSTAISNLLLITGNYMRPGTGAYPLRGHNNVQGAGDHGAMPNEFPGYQSVDDPQIRLVRDDAGQILGIQIGVVENLVRRVEHRGAAMPEGLEKDLAP